MFRYRNEASFSKAVCNHLKKQGWFIQRIESGITGRGIPDIFAVAPNGRPMWIELKRVHQIGYTGRPVVIPWRPGQQAWLHEVNKKGCNCITLACFDNVILHIDHNKIYKENRVEWGECEKYWGLQAL